MGYFPTEVRGKIHSTEAHILRVCREMVDLGGMLVYPAEARSWQTNVADARRHPAQQSRTGYSADVWRDVTGRVRRKDTGCSKVSTTSREFHFAHFVNDTVSFSAEYRQSCPETPVQSDGCPLAALSITAIPFRGDSRAGKTHLGSLSPTPP